METASVQCPSCGRFFEVALPPAEEQPCEVDYDCEVCCHPLLLRFDHDEAVSLGLADL